MTTVTARSPKYSGRLRPPATVQGEGEDELAALTDLALRLGEIRDVERRMALEERSRAAHLHGAEEQSRATLSRPLTKAELERVLERASGALACRSQAAVLVRKDGAVHPLREP